MKKYILFFNNYYFKKINFCDRMQKNNTKGHKISVPEKKYKKTPKIPPKGFKSANDFFNYTFENKDLIWMGQNTNHIHDENIINDAMI